jgi:hypothetical protein
MSIYPHAPDMSWQAICLKCHMPFTDREMRNGSTLCDDCQQKMKIQDHRDQLRDKLGRANQKVKP